MTRHVQVYPGERVETHCVVAVLRAAGWAATAGCGTAVCDGVIVLAVDEVDPAEVLAAHRSEFGTVPALLVTPLVDDASLRLARSCTATGVLSSRSPTSDFVLATGQLLNGTLQLPQPAGVSQVKEACDVLTGREHEIVGLLVSGWSNDQIARDLDISYHTVRTHVQNILLKMGVRHRHALTGLVPHSALASHRPVRTRPAPSRVAR